MKYEKVIYMCIAIIIAIFVLYKFIGNAPKSNKITPQPQKQNTLSTQTNSEGAVTIKVIPENVSEDKKIWQFRIVLDTHTGSLDEDLIQLALLQNDQGENLRPKTWEGSPPGGHHREGTLAFEPFPLTPKSVTLILQSVGGVSERKFTWNIK